MQKNKTSSVIVDTQKDVMPSLSPRMAPSPKKASPKVVFEEKKPVEEDPKEEEEDDEEEEEVNEDDDDAVSEDDDGEEEEEAPKTKDPLDVNEALAKNPGFADAMSKTIPISPKAAEAVSPKTPPPKKKSPPKKKETPKKTKKPMKKRKVEEDSEEEEDDDDDDSEEEEEDDEEDDSGEEQGIPVPAPPPPPPQPQLSPEQEIAIKLSIIQDINELSRLGFIPCQMPSPAMPIDMLKQIRAVQNDQKTQEMHIGVYGLGLTKVIGLIEALNTKLDPGKYVGCPFKLSGAEEVVGENIDKYRSPFIRIYKKMKERGISETPIWAEIAFITGSILAEVHHTNTIKEKQAEAERMVSDPEVQREAAELRRKLGTQYSIPPSTELTEDQLASQLAGFDINDPDATMPVEMTGKKKEAAVNGEYVKPPSPPPKSTPAEEPKKKKEVVLDVVEEEEQDPDLEMEDDEIRF